MSEIHHVIASPGWVGVMWTVISPLWHLPSANLTSSTSPQLPAVGPVAPSDFPLTQTPLHSAHTSTHAGTHTHTHTDLLQLESYGASVLPPTVLTNKVILQMKKTNTSISASCCFSNVPCNPFFFLEPSGELNVFNAVAFSVLISSPESLPFFLSHLYETLNVKQVHTKVTEVLGDYGVELQRFIYNSEALRDCSTEHYM